MLFRSFDKSFFNVEGSVQPIIKTVKPGGLAESSGLVPGDVVLSVNGISGLNNFQVVEMLRQGKGVPQDEIEAYRWFSRAADNRNEKIRTTALASQNQLARTMMAAQIMEAEAVVLSVAELRCWKIFLQTQAHLPFFPSPFSSPFPESFFRAFTDRRYRVSSGRSPGSPFFSPLPSP